MANTKRYACPYCGKMMGHDQVHQHVQHTCPKRTKR